MLPVFCWDRAGKRHEVSWPNASDMIRHLGARLEAPDTPGQPLSGMTRSELLTTCAGLGVAHDPHISVALIIRSIQRLRDGASVVDVQSEVAQAIIKAKLAATPVQMPI